MRTTISIDDALLRQVRALAVASGSTLSEFVEQSLRVAVARREGPRPPVRLTTVAGDGLMPGVDLDDSAALLDLMEASERDAPV